MVKIDSLYSGVVFVQTIVGAAAFSGGFSTGTCFVYIHIHSIIVRPAAATYGRTRGDIWLCFETQLHQIERCLVDAPEYEEPRFDERPSRQRNTRSRVG